MNMEINQTGVGKLLTIPQVAKILSVSNATCYRLAESKELTSIRFMGSIRVQEADLKKFLQEHRVELKRNAIDEGQISTMANTQIS